MRGTASASVRRACPAKSSCAFGSTGAVRLAGSGAVAAGVATAETVSVEATRATRGSRVLTEGGSPGPGPPRDQAGGSKLAQDACARRACADDRLWAYDAVGTRVDGAWASFVDDC